MERIDSLTGVIYVTDSLYSELALASGIALFGLCPLFIGSDSTPTIVKCMFIFVFVGIALVQLIDCDYAESVEVNTKKGKFIVTRRGIWRKRRFAYNISDIKSFLVEKCPERRYYTFYGRLYRIWVVLQGNVRVPLTESFLTGVDSLVTQAKDMSKLCKCSPGKIEPVRLSYDPFSGKYD